MASTRDVHDIMGMGGGPVQKPVNKKKKKIVEAQPRLSGISREVQALMGDSVPPVQIVETPKYKSKPSLAAKLYKPRHWEERPYTPGARDDSLSLKHWKRALPMQRPTHAADDATTSDGQNSQSAPEYRFEDDFPTEKWNVSIRLPEYSDEQYEKHYKTDDWTREETDYLMRIVADFDLRWILVADRYDPLEIVPPPVAEASMDLIKQYPPRTVEQLKHRYYQIAAHDLEMRTPKSTMNPSEFALFEKMRNFDAKTEAMRKAMAEKLFERTREEAEEERSLLEELHRITKNEEDFINMRRDLYARLEAAPSLRRNERGEEQNIVLSSAGLSDLLSRLFAKEKLLKRRLPAPNEGHPPSQQSTVEGRGRSNTQLSRRDTLETPVDNKKASISHPVPKSLTKAEEEKYGISHPPERLTSGVSFRHEKINRVTTAKSQVQTQKINAALTELEIPARLSMPTEKVCREFERLVGQIQLLLDARKTLTRVTEEVKTLEEMRRQRLGEPSRADQDSTTNTDPGPSSTSKVSATQPNSLSTSQDNDDPSQSKTNEQEDGEPGPAIDEDDEDADGEDDIEASNIERTEIDAEDDDDDDDQDNTHAQEDSMAQQDEDDEDAENDEDEDADEDADEDEDNEQQDEESDDDEGMTALRKSMRERNVNDDDDSGDNDEEEDDNPDPTVEEDDEDEGDDEDDDDVQNPTQDVTMDEVEPEDGDPDVEPETTGNGRPTSAGSRSHKRGASVVSDASGAGSNRSGIGRKRKR